MILICNQVNNYNDNLELSCRIKIFKKRNDLRFSGEEYNVKLKEWPTKAPLKTFVARNKLCKRYKCAFMCLIYCKQNVIKTFLSHCFKTQQTFKCLFSARSSHLFMLIQIFWSPWHRYLIRKSPLLLWALGKFL